MKPVKPANQFSSKSPWPSEEMKRRLKELKEGRDNPNSNCGKRAMIELVAGYPGVKKEDYL